MLRTRKTDDEINQGPWDITMGNPKDKKNLVSVGIGYAYPSSPRAGYFGVEKYGCWFVYFNPDKVAHTGPFKTSLDAQKWINKNHPELKKDRWCMSHTHPSFDNTENQ